MEEDKGAVNRSSGPCPAARSNRTQEDHCGERGALLCHTPPRPLGGEHTHVQ